MLSTSEGKAWIVWQKALLSSLKWRNEYLTNVETKFVPAGSDGGVFHGVAAEIRAEYQGKPLIVIEPINLIVTLRPQHELWVELSRAMKALLKKIDEQITPDDYFLAKLVNGAD